MAKKFTKKDKEKWAELLVNKTPETHTKPTTPFPHHWDLFGGHIEQSETAKETIIREIWEEVGIKINPKDLKLVHIMHREEYENPRQKRICFFWLAKRWQGTPHIKEPTKCDRLNWFELNSLPKNTIPYIVQAIKSSLKKIFYSEYGWKHKKN